MNNIFKIVWSRALETWVVASELAQSRGSGTLASRSMEVSSSSSSRKGRSTLTITLLALLSAGVLSGASAESLKDLLNAGGTTGTSNGRVTYYTNDSIVMKDQTYNLSLTSAVPEERELSWEYNGGASGSTALTLDNSTLNVDGRFITYVTTGTTPKAGTFYTRVDNKSNLNFNEWIYIGVPDIKAETETKFVLKIDNGSQVSGQNLFLGITGGIELDRGSALNVSTTNYYNVIGTPEAELTRDHKGYIKFTNGSVVNIGSDTAALAAGDNLRLITDKSSTYNLHNVYLYARTSNPDYNAITNIGDGKTKALLRLFTLDAYGSVDLNIADKSVVETAVDGEFINGLTGKGRLNVKANNIFNRAQANFEGSTEIAEGKSALVSINNALGKEAKIIIKKDATMTFVDGKVTELHNALDSVGQINVGANNVKVTGNHSTFTGTVNVAPKNATWNIVQSGNYDFLYQLKGEGNVLVSAGDAQKNIHFKNKTDPQGFTGTFTVNQGILNLDRLAQNALKNADLTLKGSSSTGKVLDDLTVKSLTMDNSTLAVTNDSNSEFNLITATEGITLTGNNKVEIANKDLLGKSSAINNIKPTGTLLDQQNQVVTGEIFALGKTAGDRDSIVLVDSSGNAITNVVKTSKPILGQEGKGTAYYDYSRLVADDTGIHAGYGLTALSANKGQSVSINSSAAKEQKLFVKLTGDGGFTYTGSKLITVTNGENNYLGDSILKSGQVLLGANNALGEQGALLLQDQSNLDLATFAQNASFTTIDQNSVLNLNSGNLTLTANQASLIEGQLEGGKDSSLNLNQGALTVNSSNNTLEAEINLGSKATATLAKTDGLGKGDINLTGSNKIAINGAGDFANRVQGDSSNQLNINGADGAVTLTADNSKYAGELNIADKAEVNVKALNNLGTGILGVAGILQFNSGVNGDLNNAFKGAGKIVLTDNQLAIKGDHTGFTGTARIGEKATWSVTQAGDYDINYALSGNGTATVNAGGMIALKNAGDQSFTGTFDVTKGQLQLDQTGFDLLTNASLGLKGGQANLMLDGQKVKNLTLNTGALYLAPFDQAGTRLNHLTVDGTIKLVGQDNFIKVDSAKSVEKHDIDWGSSFVGKPSFIDQQYGVIGETLVYGKVDKTEGTIFLADKDGNYIRSEDVALSDREIQAGSGKASYGFNGLLPNEEGIHLNYGLAVLDAYQGKNIEVLTTTENTEADHNILRAKLTGEGGFVFKGDKAIVIDGFDNDYKGDTKVYGHVTAKSDNVFGKQGGLYIEPISKDAENTSAGIFDLGSYQQQVSFFIIDSDGLLNLNKGTLIVNAQDERSIVYGDIRGEEGSKLIFEYGGFNVKSRNEPLKSDIYLTNNASISLIYAEGLGSAKVHLGSVDEEKGNNIIRLHNGGQFVTQLLGDESNTFVILSSKIDNPVVLASDNSQFSGLIVIAKNAYATANELENVGKGILQANGVLTLNKGMSGVLSNGLQGSGNIILNGSNLEGVGKHDKFTGLLNLAENATWSVTDRSGDYNINYGLAGNGTMNVGAEQNILLNNENKNQSYTGNFNVHQGNLVLNTTAGYALKTGNVHLLAGTKGTVENDLIVGSLELDKSTLKVTATDGKFNLLTATNGIVLEGDTKVEIDNKDLLGNAEIDTDKGLLDQQNIANLGELFAKGKTSGDKKLITLIDADGNEITEVKDIHIQLKGQEIAGDGIYDYTGLVADEIGIHAGYGLKALSANSGQSIKIDSTGADEQKLFVKLTGEGGFTYTGDKAITVTGENNDYLGDSTFAEGQVALGADNALGQQGALIFTGISSLDLSKFSQVADSVTQNEESTINLNSGHLTLTDQQDSTFEGALSGTDQSSLTVEKGALNVTSSNAELASKVHLGSHVIANLAKADALGKGKIHLAENSVINVNGSGNFANELMGDSSAALNIQGTDSDVTLLGDNSAYSGTLDIAENAKANVTNLNNLGEALLGIDGTLHFNEGVNGELRNAFAGTGAIILTNNQIKMLGAKDDTDFTGLLSLGDDAHLSVEKSGFYRINYDLLGTGTIGITADSTINFMPADGRNPQAFNGTFNVHNGALQLNQKAFEALTTANLGLLGGEAHLTVSDQSVKNLTMKEGTIYLTDPDKPAHNNHLKVTETIILEGDKNYIGVNKESLEKKEVEANEIIAGNPSFLDQQFGGKGEVLLSSGNDIVVKDNSGAINQDFEAIFLTDLNKELITGKDLEHSTGSLQDGAGIGYYGFNGLRTEGKEIYLSYGLDEIDAQEDRAVLITSNNDEIKTESRDLRIRLTGEGGFTFTGDAPITLSGNLNTYSGNTILDNTNITAGMDQVFGVGGNLDLNGESTFDLGNFRQQIDTLKIDKDSTLNLNNGALHLVKNEASEIIGTIKGSEDSKLHIKQGIVNVQSSNADLETTIDLDNKVTLNLAQADSLGRGDIVMNSTELEAGNNTINLNAGGQFANQLTGDASNNFNIKANTEGKAVELTADNSGYAGSINIAEKAEAEVNVLNNLGSGLIDIAGGLTFKSGASGNFDNQFKGGGSITLTDNLLTVNGNHHAFNGILNLGETANWTIARHEDYRANYQLAGNGSMTVAVESGDVKNLANIQFTNKNKSDFGGHLYVKNGNLQLDDGAQNALEAGNLHFSNGSQGTVLQDITVGSLELVNSTLKVTDQDGKFNILTASNGIALKGDTKVEIDNKDLLGKGQAIEEIKPKGTLLDQQNQLTLGETFARGKTSGDRDSITLVDSEGNVVSDIFDVKKAIVGQEENGVAIYDYSKLVADDTGIHAGYGLAALSANADKVVTIDSEDSTETTLSVKLTGEGGFTYTGDQAITVTGQQNDYQGASTIEQGSVNLGADNALGKKGALVLTGGALNLAGFAQRADHLTADEKSKLDLAGGTLSLTNGVNTIAGEVAGDSSATLNVEQGSLTVSSNNADLSAEINLGEKVTATLESADGLGKGDIHLAGANKIDINGGGDFANNLTGENVDNALNLNTGAVNLLGNNSAYAGAINIGKEAQANVNRLRNLGTGLVDIAGKLNFANSTVSGDFNNAFTGTGEIKLNGNTLNVTGEHDGFGGILNLAEGSTWSVTDREGGYNINYGLTGKGTINVGTKGAIALKKEHVDNFVGDFNVKQGDLVLDNNGLSTLEKASLGLIGGSATLMEDGQSLKNLIFDQGAMTLNTVTDEERFNHLTVTDTISLRGDQNKIQVDPAIIPVHDKDLGNVDQKISFLDQQFGETGETLISGNVAVYDHTGALSSDFEAIFLADKEGKLIESKDVGQSTALIQNGEGRAYYGFNGLKTDDKGIHLNYGLDELEAFSGHNIVVLSDTSNVETESRDLRVHLTGEGGFIFKGDQAITLSGVENDYTGNTLIDGASITAGMDQVFGIQGNLTLEGNSQFDLGQFNQQVDTLMIEESSLLNLKRGTFTLDDNEVSTVNGLLQGVAESKLNITQGIVNINSRNSGLQSAVNLGNDVIINLAEADGLGSSIIALNQGSNTINLNGGGQFANQLTGDASNNFNIKANTEGKAVELTADNSGYAGSINIAEKAEAEVNALNNLGTGLLGVAGKLAFNSEASGDLNNAFAGAGTIALNGNTLNVTGKHDGFTGLLELMEGSTWSVTGRSGDYNINYALAGSGTMNVGAEQNILLNNKNENQTYSGNFNVHQGNLVLNTTAGYALKTGNVHLLAGTKGTVETDITVGSLELDQSTLKVTATDGKFNLLTATNGIALKGDTQVQIDSISQLGHAEIESDKNVLDQQNIANLGELFAKGETSGDQTSITLIDAEGNAITEVNNVHIALNGQETAGDGIYDYTGLVADEIGIHAGYGLKALLANKDQSVKIDSTGADEQNLFVKLTGEGGFTYTGDQAITITGQQNDYQGASTIEQGSVNLGADNALGEKGALVLTGGALNLAGFTQRADQLTVDEKSMLDLAGGTLSLTKGDNTIAGKIAGDGSSTLNVEKGSLKVDSRNADLSAAINLGSEVAATLANADGLGKGDIHLAGANEIDINGGGNFANNLTGEDVDNTLNLNTGEINLLGNNSEYAGSINIAEKAQANVNRLRNLGTGLVDIAGKLNFANSTVSGDFNNAFTGTGEIKLNGNTLNVTGKHDGFTGLLNLMEDSTWSVTNQQGDYNINYGVTGGGTMRVSAAGKIAFTQDLTQKPQKNFTGYFDVTKGDLALDDKGLSVLENASLALKGGSATLMEDGQSLKNLTFDQGAMTLNTVTDEERFNHLTVTDTISLKGDQNKIQVDPAIIPVHDKDLGNVDQKISFLDQQFGETGETLISGNVAVYDNTGALNSDFEAIFLADKDGKLIESKDVGQSTALIQNDAGRAYYGFNGLRTDDKGIYLNYGLDEIEAFEGRIVTVKSDRTNVTQGSRDLRVELVGKGGFTFTGDEAITLSGNLNTYTGDTLLDNTQITAGMDQVFGIGGDLTLKDQSKFNLGTFNQQIDSLQVAGASTLDLQKGNLSLMNNGNSTIDGALLGEEGSQLNINQGIVNVNSSNSGLQSAVNLGNDVIINLAEADGLGSSTIALNQGSNTINLNGGGQFANQLTGDASNQLNINVNEGKVAVDLIADNSGYSGSINIAEKAEAQVNALNNLGSGLIGIAGNLAFNSKASGDFNNQFKGTGEITLHGNTLNVLGNHEGFTGLLNLTEDSIWSVSDRSGNYNINYGVTGGGTMRVSAAGKIAFTQDLTQKPQKNFTGYFDVTKGDLALDDKGLSVLENASLALKGGSATLMEDGQSLKNLTFDQGAMTLNTVTDEERFNHLTVTDTISLRGDQNKIQVDPAIIPVHDKDLGNVDQKISFLDQQFGEKGETLISGQVIVQDNNGVVNPDFEAIFLADKDGKLIESKDVGQSTALIQNDAGKAYYGFNGLKTDEHGIHLNYGLDELEAFKDKNIVVLSDTSNVNTDARDLRVELVGEGGFIFKGSEAITLSGNENSYTGNTLIDGTSITAGMNHVFGQAGNLTISNKGAFDLSEKKQIVDTLAIEEGSTLDIRRGELTVRESSTLKGGTLLGAAGTFIFAGKSGDEELTIEGIHNVGVDTTLQNGRMNITKDAIYGNGNGTVTVENSGVLGGYGSLKGNLLLQGELNVGSTMSRTVGEALGNFTVNGNFKAEKGSLIRIASDGKEAGRLIIAGNAEGESQLQVNDMQGQDLIQLADGTKKVEVVTIGGDLNTLELTQKGRAVRGAFDYRLEKGGDGNWWLVAKSGNDGGNGDKPVYRPETAAYTGGLDVANRLFTHQLADRNYLDPSSRLWTIMGGDFGKFYDDGKHNRTTIDSFRMMLGGDIVQTQIEEMPVKVGLFAAYGHSSIKSRQAATGLSAKGRSNGFGLGLYATLGDKVTEGLYLDGSIQYVHFRNKISGDELVEETMKTKGLITSLEGGYTWQLAESFYLQPQAQITWMGAKMDSLTDHYGTHISGSKNNIETRLGARLFMEKTLESGHHVTPYLELNYYHNSKPFYTYFDETKIEQKGTRNVGEMKLGFEGKVEKDLNIWGEVGYRKGSNSYHNTTISVGLRYDF
ncbi:autotransporter outer membrane beta-barrel domain-containing protein [Ignatzschineria cameli]|uniref:Autotransporter domain-containing protein n=1 Tax=Ignatzschineria cameli TaxID=2182793 RepID=A0A2U2ASJ2_9GAMM|nr:autotransporter outer membrane beta-barrel domain-containing protein [Ignatzschineria cameli]PWD87713.1 hypothetical protein DC077_00020 [Ignatzschineria cameli]